MNLNQCVTDGTLHCAGAIRRSDDVPIDRVRDWEGAFLQYISNQHPGVYESINETFELTEENEKKLQDAITSFNSTWA